MALLRTALLVILMGLSVLPGPAALAQENDPDPFPRTVIDGTGTPVRIPERPRQVALLGQLPMLAWIVTADELAMIDPGAPAGTTAWAGTGLLIAPIGTAVLYPDAIDAAVAAGVPVFQAAPSASLGDWLETLTTLGRVTGREDRAGQARSRIDARLESVARRVRERPPVRTLVLTPEGYTFGQNTLITDMIACAGGANAAAQAGFDDYRQIDDTTIRELAPDVILLTPAWDAATTGSFVASEAFSTVPAHRSGRIVRLPFSPTLVRDPATAVVVLALILHPAALFFR